jgi:hypothetical protein
VSDPEGPGFITPTVEPGTVCTRQPVTVTAVIANDRPVEIRTVTELLLGGPGIDIGRMLRIGELPEVVIPAWGTATVSGVIALPPLSPGPYNIYPRVGGRGWSSPAVTIA